MLLFIISLQTISVLETVYLYQGSRRDAKVLSSRGSAKLTLLSLCLQTQMAELPPNRNVPPVPPLPPTSWCKRAEVKTLRRETNGTPLLTCLPSSRRCCTLPESKRDERNWRRIP